MPGEGFRNALRRRLSLEYEIVGTEGDGAVLAASHNNSCIGVHGLNASLAICVGKGEREALITACRHGDIKVMAVGNVLILSASQCYAIAVIVAFVKHERRNTGIINHDDTLTRHGLGG